MLKQNEIYNKFAVYAAVFLMTTLFASLNSSVMQYVILKNMDEGVQYSVTQLQNNDMREYVVNVYLGVAMLVFAIAFISWFYRAFSNIKKIDNQVEDSEWWTIFGWIVPVFNLFKPYQLLVKMIDITYLNFNKLKINMGKEFSKYALLMWWILFLIYSGSKRIGTTYYFGSEDSGERYLLDVTVVDIITSVLAFVASIIIYSFLKHYEKIESRLTEIVEIQERRKKENKLPPLGVVGRNSDHSFLYNGYFVRVSPS